MKTELFRCDVCGTTARLQSGKRHWCQCNPSAPFYFYSVKGRKITDALVGAIRPQIKPYGHQLMQSAHAETLREVARTGTKGE